ncbi:metalloprotease [Gordonia sp. AC31]|uniref:metalloprotease n=1 Tax=Gordonia sp. AC31 TaxID=2962571 RepID=UPI0028812B2C|nr:metalloprotease [Gordonia sp. AC31]MDT0220309.1 metalloprotease [Gordonia sp. AC31]
MIDRRGPLAMRWAVALAAVVTLTVGSGCALIPSEDSGEPRPSSASTSSAPSPTPSRSTDPTGDADAAQCRPDDCPKLPTPTAELMTSGVTPSNVDTAVPDYLTTLLDDLDQTWGGWFDELGWGDPAPGRVLIESGTSFATECIAGEEDSNPVPIPSDEANAFFCGVDTEPNGEGTPTEGSIVLPVDTFAAIWDGNVFGVPSPIVGDFTAAIVVAHEYGHNVVFRMAEAFDIPDSRLPAGKNSELIADCLAANWGATAYQRDALGAREILQVATLLPIIGDTGGASGHGSARERAVALTVGLTGPQFNRQGQPVDCIERYWPEFFEVE